MNIKSSTGSRRLFALCFMAYSIVYIGRKNFSACMTGMIADGVIDKLSGGAAGTAFLAAYACGQLINGMLGDHVDPKIMISGGLFGAGVFNLAMGLNSSSYLFPIIWGLCGYSCSMIWSPIVRCLSQWIDEPHRSSAGAKISVTIPLGAIASYLVCALFLYISGWRMVFYVCSAILICTSLIFWFGMLSLRSYIAETDAAAHVEIEHKRADDAGNSGSVKGKNILLLIISTGLLFAVVGIVFNGILKDGLDLWVPSFISEYFGLNESVAAVMTAILPIVNLSGVFVARFVNDRFVRNELATCAILFCVSLLSLILLTLITMAKLNSLFIAIVSVLLISVTSSTMLGINSMLLTFIPFYFASIGRSSSVSGFLNSCSYAAASLSGILFGVISFGFGWAVTIAIFAATALLGAVVCAAGIKAWKKGRNKLTY